MAKKKQDNLNIEEKLQSALVPDWESPYKIPKNWVWTRVKTICNLSKGKKESRDILPYLEAKYLRGKIEPVFKKSGNLIHKDSKVILVDGENSGEVFHVNENGYMGSTFKLLYLTKYVNDDIFEYFISMYKDEFKNSKTGSAIPHLNKDLFYNLPFPLPPIAEQHRIVHRIKNLFFKLDEAKKLAQFALDSFEKRKSTILHKAFTGELTKKWRKEHGIGMDSWDEKALKDVLDVRDGTHESPVYQDIGYPLITSKNLKNGQLNYDNVKYITQEDYDSINQRSKVEIYDILFAMIGTIGNPVVIVDEPNYSIKNVALLKSINKINPFFTKYYLETKRVKDKMVIDAKGSTQKFVSLGYLRLFPVVVPTDPEQIEIVRILDSIFAKEQSAKELTDIIEKIDLMKKAILARAFRGELGTNNPEEESAKVLLKEILLTKKEPEKKESTAIIKIPPEIDKILHTNIEREIYRCILKNKTADMTMFFNITKKFSDINSALFSLRKKNLIKEKKDKYTLKKVIKYANIRA